MRSIALLLVCLAIAGQSRRFRSKKEHHAQIIDEYERMLSDDAARAIINNYTMISDEDAQQIITKYQQMVSEAAAEQIIKNYEQMVKEDHVREFPSHYKARTTEDDVQQFIRKYESMSEDDARQITSNNENMMTDSGLQKGSAAILLCNYTITMKMILVFSAAVLGIGGWNCLNRHPNNLNRDVQNRASLALAIPGGAYLGLAYLGCVPPKIAGLFNVPEVSMHYVIDLAVNPLMLSNLGYLSGYSPSSMLMTMMCSELSSAALLASTMSQFKTRLSLILLGAGVGMMVVTVYTLNKLPECARNLSTLNKARVQTSVDFLLFSWTLFIMLHGLTIAEALHPDAAILSFALFDATSKLGVSHLSTKSSQAIKNAQERFRQAGALGG